MALLDAIPALRAELDRRLAAGVKLRDAERLGVGLDAIRESVHGAHAASLADAAAAAFLRPSADADARDVEARFANSAQPEFVATIGYGVFDSRASNVVLDLAYAPSVNRKCIAPGLAHAADSPGLLAYDCATIDPRLDKEFQAGNELYTNNDLDRGHMVRRLDPVWGSDEEANLANEDTFHYTNSCPQHKNLNQKTWNDLEDYVLENAGKHRLRLNVFTGPVFRDDEDPEYRGFLVPLDYWKVVVIKKDDGRLSATAYTLSQRDLVTGLEFVFGEFRTYQVPLRQIEEWTGLSFGELRRFDPKEELESAAPTAIEGAADIIL